MTFISFLSFFLFFNAHPIHISLTYVNFNEKNNSIEISHKIFLDDFERALEAHYGEKLHLTTGKENPESEKIMDDYLKNHFAIKVNNKKMKGGFVGKEYDYDAVWIYQEIKDPKKLKNLTITNNVLQEIYNDQKNVIHIDYQEIKKSMLLEIGKDSETIIF